MTISYSDKFWKLLLRWKGSLWKACWFELAIFCVLYAILSVIYRCVLDDPERLTFEKVVLLFDGYSNATPITFVLGFYVTSVVTRWWSQFESISWPDDIMPLVRYLLPDKVDKNNVMVRRTIASRLRYLLLSTALCWRDISKPVMVRFPTIRHFVMAGMMTEEEFLIYKETTIEAKWFLPIEWAQSVACKYGPDVHPAVMYVYIALLSGHRQKLRRLYCYDWVCFPLVYTQVAALVTYSFVAMCIIGRQFLKPAGTNPADLYVPIFTIMQIVFYVGWFKVGKYIMSPFGDDDDDLELNYLLDRHAQVSMALADEISAQCPTIQQETIVTAPNGYLAHTKKSWKLKSAEHPPKSMVRPKFVTTDDHELIHGIHVENMDVIQKKLSKARPF